MNWMNSKWILGLGVLVFLASCTDDGSGDDPVITDGVVEIDISNLPDNGDNFKYHAWLVSGGVNYNLGTFDVVSGIPSTTQWSFNDFTTLENADKVLISMSHVDVTPSGPDNMVMMEANFGTVSANAGTLTTAPMSAGGESLSGAIGSYLLATPTTSTMSEEFTGIWFTDTVENGIANPGLVLPSLTSGWTYQGWVDIGNNQMLRTGKFYNPDFEDLESVYNGPGNGYDVPGEDFNSNLPGAGNPPDLRGRKVWLTVQPDTLSDQFFALPIFYDTIISTVHLGTPLTNTFPDFSGIAYRR